MANSYGDILHTVRQAFSNPLPDTTSDDLLIAQMTRALRGATAKKPRSLCWASALNSIIAWHKVQH